MLKNDNHKSKSLEHQFGRVAVMMGGDSAEREVSLKSGQAALQALKRKGIDAFALDVSFNHETHKQQEHTICQQISTNTFDTAFIALHGRGGEDGIVQGVLEAQGIPYSGCGVLASAIGMDKLRTKLLWAGNELPTPPFELVEVKPLSADKMEAIDEQKVDTIAQRLGFPVIVKPVHEGSSIGMNKADDKAALKEALTQAAQYDNEILVEKWIVGKEYTAAVLNGRVLPLIELEVAGDFYDYQAKYIRDDTVYHCPCGLNKEQQSSYQALALHAFDSLGARGWGRVDFMCDEQGQAWLIEINTVPGLTSHSLVPMAAKAAGINFDDLIVQILATAVKK